MHTSHYHQNNWTRDNTSSCFFCIYLLVLIHCRLWELTDPGVNSDRVMKLTQTIICISAILVLLCGQAIGQSCTVDTQLADCTNPNLPLCVSGACAACSSGESSACDTRNYATPVCDADTGACVACTDGTQCDFDPNRPICLNTGDLVGCYECANVTGECYNRTSGLAPFCYTDGHCGGCASDYGKHRYR